MVAEFSGRSTELIKALASLPQIWQLTPVNGDKRPYKGDWQKKGLDRKTIESELKSGKAKGYGLLTGEKSGGVLAIDADGPAAHELLASYGELPPTVAFTSGKVGRCQYLLQVGESYWSIIKTIKLNTGLKGENGKDQLLEFRWDGCQSVLPPSVHPETGRYQWVNSPDSVEVAECPAWVIEMIMNAEDAPNSQPALSCLPLSYQPKNNPLDDISLPVPASIPLEICLAKSSRELLKGVGSGGRNDAGAALARDLLGTANHLQAIGQSFDGDPHRMLEDFASQCSPPLPSKEVNSIWKSAERGNPTPASTVAGVDNCIRGWYWQNHVKNNHRVSNSKVIHPEKFKVPPISLLKGDIDALIEADLRKSEVTLKVADLSQKYRQPHSEVWRIYREREEELEQEANHDAIASELAQLLASKSVKLNLLEILPQGLAEGITRLAETLNIKPECYVLALLTQVSALLKPGTSTMLYPQTNFKVCPNYFGATIGESSQKKTPVKVAVISEPMEQMIDASIQAFEAAKIAYEEELNLWKKNDQPDKGLMPKPPAQRIYHITTATGESIPKQAARMPDQSLLWVADELAGTFKSANQYRGGKGSDEEDLLEYWSGGGAAVLRAEGLTVNARKIGLSIFGNIQPKVLAQFLKDGNDDNGKFARFDFVQQPLAATELFEDAPNVNITPMLADLYKRLDPLPAQKFKLDKEARKAFIAYNNQCERERINHPKQGMRAMLGKAPEKVGKVATILHCIDSAFRCVEVSESISVEVVQAAIKWVTYTTSQALSVNLEICDATALAPNFDKIISLARKKGGAVSARDAQNSFDHKLKIKSQQVKEWFTQLEAMKYGKVSTVKKSVLFTLAADNDATVVNCSHAVDKEKLQLESLHHNGLTPTVVTVVSDSPPSEKSNNQILDSQNQPLTTHTVTTVGSNVEPESINDDYSTPKPLTTVTTASTETAPTAQPAPPIASPEPETAPTEPESSEIEPEMGVGDEIFEAIKEAIATLDRAAARFAWQKIKNSPTQKEAVKAKLTEEEVLNFKILVATGWLKGMRVKYVGTKLESLAGVELTIDKIDRNGITCTKPDGSYITDLDKEDLVKQELSEGGA